VGGGVNAITEKKEITVTQRKRVISRVGNKRRRGKVMRRGEGVSEEKTLSVS